MQEEVNYTPGIIGVLKDCRWRFVLIWFFYNLLVFYATRLLTRNRAHVNLETVLDRAIPFQTPWILIYIVVAFFSWYTGYVLLAGEKKETAIYFFGAEYIAKSICLIFFLAMPTTVNRPEVTGHSIFDWMTRQIFSADTPDNLFPSIHCLESWLLARSASSIKRLGKWYAPTMYVVAIVVFLSTLFVKQHVAWDVLGGVLAAEIGLLMMKVIRKNKEHA